MSAVSWCKVGVLSSVLASVFAWGAASSVAFEPTPNELSELSTVITKAAPSSMIEDVMSKTLSKATFAGGCFWCMEAPFDELDGVESTTSGYAGGTLENPTYTQVSAGSTGHAEVVQVVYDPEKVSYETLLKVFWQNVDPTVADRQFCDTGHQYRTAIFFHSAEQEKAAQASAKHIADQLKAAGKADRIYTEISALKAFYPAEDYHQDYYQRNPIRYKYYRYRCGRDARLESLWGDPS